MYTLIGIVFLSLSGIASGNNTADGVDKSILRYGFQNTQECDNFEKAFICIQKCQDLNYDSAATDKNCKCTCYMKPELQKHKIKSNTTRNDWKSGAPTTKLPIWAQTTNTDVTDDGDDDTTEDTNVGSSSTDHNESLNDVESTNSDVSVSVTSSENDVTETSTVNSNDVDITTDGTDTEHTSTTEPSTTEPSTTEPSTTVSVLSP